MQHADVPHACEYQPIGTRAMQATRQADMQASCEYQPTGTRAMQATQHANIPPASESCDVLAGGMVRLRGSGGGGGTDPGRERRTYEQRVGGRKETQATEA